MTCTGTFRVYFNRHQAAPLVWCVALESGDKGTQPAWEIAVRSVSIHASTTTIYSPSKSPDDETRAASAYMLATGTLSVTDTGHAVIAPTKQGEKP
jgi:hypothetical protein